MGFKGPRLSKPRGVVLIVTQALAVVIGKGEDVDLLLWAGQRGVWGAWPPQWLLLGTTAPVGLHPASVGC